ncbi:MAG: hypothetical protein A2W31_02670 [Planctomycetes bacterium RBG_16_64_10]|nr:MAG: hypothetical protein A2W31_02670 [Planctomycetes bacterium RBG_16_64_10]
MEACGRAPHAAEAARWRPESTLKDGEFQVMDRRCYHTLLAFSLTTGLVGCGDQPGTPSPQAKSAERAAVAGQGTSAGTSPAQTVFCFLEAVRLGDDTAASHMLTDLARQKTAEINMVVAPPGSDTASFRVGQTTMVQDGLAHVACCWTDLDNEGKPRTDEIVWTVRRSGRGWRIAGMAAKIFPDRPPVQLNFEDPQEMLRQQKLVEHEAIQRAGQQERQASRSADQDPFQTGPK